MLSMESRSQGQQLMRAKSFITEKKPTTGKTISTQHASSPGALSAKGDRFYGLYRASMMMGKHPDDMGEIDTESMMGNKLYVGTYTPEEKDMFMSACKALGLPTEQMIEGPSKELDDTNKQSPMKGFKGYKR